MSSRGNRGGPGPYGPSTARGRKGTGLLLLSLLAGPSLLQAQELEEAFQEFLLADTVFSQEKKEIQITLKSAFQPGPDGPSPRLESELEYGISHRLQVEMGLSYLSGAPEGEEREPMQIEAGILYQLRKERRFSLSVFAEGEVSAGSDESSWAVGLTAARQLGPVQIHSSARLENGGEEKELAHHLAAAWLAARRIVSVLELNRDEWFAEPAWHITPGLVLPLTDLVELGIGVPLTLNQENWAAVFQLVLEF